MNAFFCKLIAPRPSFAQDMSPAEAQLMKDHGAYWREAMARGNVVSFGLVADPAGAYGIGIVEFEDAAAARSFTDGDPTILSQRGFRFEIQPMPFGAVRPDR
jgi:hypothetical protein